MKQRRYKAAPAISLGLLAVLMLSGCAGSPEPKIGASVVQPRSDLGQNGYSHVRSDVYLLRPTDKISVTVFREPDLSADSLRA